MKCTHGYVSFHNAPNGKMAICGVCNATWIGKTFTEVEAYARGKKVKKVKKVPAPKPVTVELVGRKFRTDM